MVGVAQLVEHPVVVRDVAGSSPVAHPNHVLEKLHPVYQGRKKRPLIKFFGLPARFLEAVFNTAPADRNLGRA